ncbi:MAG: hypothetical protein JWP97_3263 [Labilithrix sp.]|nr:hypothetical protein [Labilithrix sp.]
MSQEGRFSRAGLALVPGLLAAVPAVLPVWLACVRASWSTIGRDQGIFQYVAWAASRGEVLYRDVRDVNGPLVPMLHEALLALGGADEHRFRVLDLVFTAMASGVAGASLAALDGHVRAGGERAARTAALGLAGAVVLLGEYLAYGWWDTAQRESFFDWFVLGSIALQLTGQTRLREKSARGGLALVATAGALSAAPWLGKPTFVLFTALQAGVLLVDDVPVRRLPRIAAFAGGALAGALVPLAYLAARGDVGAWLRISLVDVPVMYRFIWPRTFAEILAMRGNGRIAGLGVAAALAVVVLVAARVMPRRALLLAVMPVAGIASVAAQAKGFRYHFHPVSAGTALAALALGQEAWSRASRRRSVPALLAAGVLVLGVGVRAGILANRDLYARLPGPGEAGFSDERLALFERVDFFPVGLRDAARHLAEHTKESETVQTYGMDPYVLFLARRRSATPYIYGYDLDADAALGGALEDGPKPTEAQRAVIQQLRDDHEADLLRRLRARPPAAFVLLDNSPLLRWADAEADFQEHCPDAYAWLRASYLETGSFEGIHVWRRIGDLEGGEPPAPPEGSR